MALPRYGTGATARPSSSPTTAARRRARGPADRRLPAASGSPRQVLPWHGLVQPGLGRQPEPPVGDDVAQDLGGAALDRVALGPQETVAGIPAVEVGPFRAAHRPVVITQPVRAGQLHLELRDLLVQPGEDQLGRRPLGAWLPGG